MWFLSIPLLIVNFGFFKFLLTVSRDTPWAFSHSDLLKALSFPGFDVGLKMGRFSYRFFNDAEFEFIEPVAFGLGAVLQTALQVLVLVVIFNALRPKAQAALS